MRCPFCQAQDTKVVDSRDANNFEQVRRRRECISCSERFTTYEVVEESFPRLLKSDNTRESFSEQKLKQGMLKALEKRPVSVEQIDKAVTDIKAAIRNFGEREVASYKVGELVMQQLYKLDEVAYVRFASVYRKFASIGEFKEEIKRIESLEEEC